MVLKIFNFQLFKALYSTCSRLRQQLQNYCKAPAISSRHVLLSIGNGNQNLGPLHIMDPILESAMIFPSQVTILKLTANWSPYIFTLVQKEKHRVYTIHVFLSEAILC